MTKADVLEYYRNKLSLEKACLEQTKNFKGEFEKSNALRKEEIARLEIVVEALQKG